MQITINKKKFIDALTIGGAMSGKAKALPILELTKITASNDSLDIFSFDGECSISKTTTAQISEDGVFAVNAPELVKVLKSLAEEEITLSISDTTLSIKHIKGSIDMPIQDASEYPYADKSDDVSSSFEIPSSKLQEWLTIASNFVSQDDLKPTMCGMYLYAENGKLGMCATDANKLYSDSIDMETNDFKAILSSRAFKPSLGIINGVDKIKVYVDDKNVTFISPDAELRCRLVDGNYPNFKAVIPSYSSIKVNVSKSELIDSVNRATLMANKTTSLLKLTIEGNEIGIEGSDVNFSKKAIEKVSCNKDGNDIVIGVKGEFFAMCLDVIESDDVVLCMDNPRRAILIDEKGREDRAILVMPMLI